MNNFKDRSFVIAETKGNEPNFLEMQDTYSDKKYVRFHRLNVLQNSTRIIVGWQMEFYHLFDTGALRLRSSLCNQDPQQRFFKIFLCSLLKSKQHFSPRLAALRCPSSVLTKVQMTSYTNMSINVCSEISKDREWLMKSVEFCESIPQRTSSGFCLQSSLACQKRT